MGIALLAGFTALLPSSAHAAEGDHVKLKFQGLDQTLLFVALGLGVLAVLYGIYLSRVVMAYSPGDDKMQDVGRAIRDGAVAYLRKQISTMLIFVVLLAGGLFALYMQSGIGAAAGVAGAFIAGVVGSYVAGSVGMMIAVNANMRTAHAALTSYRQSLNVAFKSGAVAGMLTVGIGLVGACIILLIGGEGATKYLVGFGFGGSLAALFMRVGGGIFTKAADVGADLVGKVEAGIPEDDPRNPAVIADNVGDNVGDCAGMAADVFESYIVLLVAAIVLGAGTASVLDPGLWMRMVVFALVVAGLGVLASIISIAMVKGKDDLDSDPLVPIRNGFAQTAILSVVFTFVAAYFMFGQKPLETALPVSYRVAQRADYQILDKARVEIAQKLPTQAQIDEAKEARATELKKAAKNVTTAELFPADPEKFPASLRGFSRAATERVLNKRTDPVDPLEVTWLDLVAAPSVQQAGFKPEEELRVKDLLQVRPEDFQEDGSIAGFRPIDDFNAKEPKALDYATNAPQGSFDPSNPFSPIRKAFSGTGKDELVVLSVRVVADLPARPAQQGMPASEARKIDRTLLQGPRKQSDLDKQIEDTKKQAAQENIKVSIEVVKRYPVKLLYNETTDEFAIGVVAPSDPKIYQLAENIASFNYYKKPADVLNKSYAEAQKTGTPPPVPPMTEMRFVAVQSQSIAWYLFPVTVLVGILLALAIERLTEYYVSTHMKPTQEVAGVSSGGAAPMLIQGFAFASESSAMMVLAIVVAILAPLFIFPVAVYGGYVMALYGVALVGLGLLATTGYVLAMDTFGPISDNAQGVFEMSGHAHANPVAAKAVGHLDAAGNTTKALTKGFAIATAVVAAIALFNSFRGSAMLTEIGLKLDVPEIFLGLLIGGAAPFLFSAFAINAVGRSSFQLIYEVRRQFRENPGIMTGAVRPDYGRCVEIVTAAAQRELLGPGILAIFLPIAVAFGFSIGKAPVEIAGASYNLTGAQALGGFLAGAILSGQLLAVLLANAGGMWDNAKKLIEDGMYGGKGSEAHKAAVVCDTLGDPFKDTAGPALNPLIKVMNLVALLLAPAIIMPHENGVLIAVTVVSVAALTVAVVASKKGSLSQELQKASEAGAAADAHFTRGAIDSPSTPSLSTSAPSAEANPTENRPKRRITVEDEDENS